MNPELFTTSLSQVGSTVLVVVLIAAALEALLYVLLKRVFNVRNALPIMLLAPAAVGLLLLVAYPIGYNIALAFSNMSLRRFTPDRGLTFGIQEAIANFRTVFTEPILKQATFLPVFLQTVLWTFIQVFFHVTIGLFVASLLNRPMKMRGIYRTILLFPWAIPQVVAVMAWRGEFNFQYGYINNVLLALGMDPVSWMSDPVWNYVAINITNIWLGVPFMAVILLGGLQAIDPSYYEAAEMDGATGLQRFRHVTMPLIQPVMTPAVILGVIWTFNLFNVPYFINQQELETSDILVTALFRAAFEYNRYGFASAFAIIVFLILLLFALAYMKITGFRLDISAGMRVAGEGRPARRTVTVKEASNV